MKTDLAGIYKRGQVYWFAKQEEGYRQWISLKTKSREEAIRKVLDMDADSMRKRVEVGEWEREIDTYTRAMFASQRLSRESARSRAYVLKKFGKEQRVRTPQALTTHALQRWHDELFSRNPRTAGDYLTYLRSFLAWLHDEGKVRANVAKAVKHKKIKSNPRRDYIDAATVQKLIDSTDDENLKFILYCGFHAGMRRLEITEARPEWFKDAGCVTIAETETFKPKDREARTVPLTEPFKEFLEGYGKRAPFMLRPEITQGKDKYRYNWRKLYHGHLKANGITSTIHAMRHSFASNLVIAGVSVFKVAVWLGDGVEVVQRHYAHLLPIDSDINRGTHRR